MGLVLGMCSNCVRSRRRWSARDDCVQAPSSEPVSRQASRFRVGLAASSSSSDGSDNGGWGWQGWGKRKQLPTSFFGRSETRRKGTEALFEAEFSNSLGSTANGSVEDEETGEMRDGGKCVRVCVCMCV